MKTLIVLCLLSLAHFTSAQEYISGTVISDGERTARAAVNVAAKCSTAADYSTFCTDDDQCTKGFGLVTCISGNAATFKQCMDPTGYCVGQAGMQLCSSTPGTGTCNQAANGFICKSPGYYPEPTNCSIFYYCYADPINIGALKYNILTCPSNAPFSPAGTQDKRCLIGGACVKAACTQGLTAEWRAMNYLSFTTNRIALKCTNGVAEYVYQCPAGLSLDLSFTAYPKCAIKCLTNYQKAVYPEDNTKYYICISGVTYVYDCEIGQKFNADELQCK